MRDFRIGVTLIVIACIVFCSSWFWKTAGYCGVAAEIIGILGVFMIGVPGKKA